MFVGGTDNEYVNCLAYDPSTEIIIMAGNTTSTYFAPAANDHGFVVGIDIDGNWQWGKFFYNVSYAVSTISGCRMSSDGTSLSLYAMSNAQPVVMDINTRDGYINKFFSMEWTATTADTTPTFLTYSALYYDKQDFYDNFQYIYQAFLMDSKVYMARTLMSTNTPVIDWSYEFYDYSSDEGTDKDRRKDPQTIHLDPKDNEVFYLSGRFQGYASVMKFQKRNGKMDWWAQFKQLTSIRSVAEVPNDSIFYGCGDYWENEDVANVADLATQAIYSAGVFKMTEKGRIKWFMKLTGTNPTTGQPNQDRCYGLSVDERTQYVTALMQVKASQLRDRSFGRGNFYDTVLWRFDSTGRYNNAVQITNSQEQIDMYSTSNGLTMINDNFYFAGWSAGFYTYMQSKTYTSSTTNSDAYIYIYKFDHEPSYNCFFEETISRSALTGQVTTITESSWYSSSTYMDFTEDDDDLRRTYLQNIFTPY
jgi:hypothetical protein